MSLSEVRAMPYAEFRSWQLFYLLEPFGFADIEYRTASHLAMQYNINRGKGKAKSAKDFMRNMETSVLEELKKQSFDPQELSRDELIALIKKDFGIR